MLFCLGLANYYWSTSSNRPYISENFTDYSLQTFQVCLSYYLLFKEIIPLSLNISNEVNRIFQTAWIEADANFYSLLTGKRGKCLTFNLHEDLGAVKHIFTDKTGTLTANKLNFKAISIASDKETLKLESNDIEQLS